MRDRKTILLAKDHAPETKESFHTEIMVSAFVNFEVGRLKKNNKRRCGTFRMSLYTCILHSRETLVELIMSRKAHNGSFREF